MTESVESYLERMLIKDSVKNECGGWRSVRDISRICGTRSPKMVEVFEIAVALEGKGELKSSAGCDGEVLFRATLPLAESKKKHPLYIP